MITPQYGRIPYREQIINSLNDFNDPVGSTITVENGVNYLITNQIITPYTFVPNVPGAQISFYFVGRMLSPIVYVGNDYLFNFADIGFFFSTGMLYVNAAGGKFLKSKSTTPSSSFFLIQENIFDGFEDLGIVEDSSFFLFRTIFQNIGAGISFKNNPYIFMGEFINQLSKNYERLDYAGISGSFVVGETITGGTSLKTAIIVKNEQTVTSGRLTVKTVSGQFLNGETITSASGSATVNGTLHKRPMFSVDGSLTYSVQINNSVHLLNEKDSSFYFNPSTTYLAGTISGCTFSQNPLSLGGECFSYGSVDQTNPSWRISGNSGTVAPPDSIISAQFGFQDNTVATDIAATTVPILVNATYIFSNLERVIQEAGGKKVQYSGLEKRKIRVTATMTMRPAAGTSIKLGAYIGFTNPETYAVTFTNATERVNRANHGLSNGTSLQFFTGGTLPTGLRGDQFYFVVNATTNDFQVANTVGGAAQAFTTDGTGNQFYSLGEYIVSSEMNATADSGNPNNVTIESIIEVKTGSKIGIYVDNHDTTSDIVVESLNVIL